MFTEIGEFIDTVIANFLKWNRQWPWYKLYCYLKVDRQDIELIKILYSAGYLTENSFIRLARKHCSRDEINKVIKKHREELEVVREMIQQKKKCRQ